MDEREKKKRKYGNKPREDKSTLKDPKCPFCNAFIEKPLPVWGEFTEFIAGACSCGAVYVCDETGKNLGESLMDALVYGCDGDWDRALSLNAESDYEETVLNYNYQAHTVPASMRIFLRGKLVFVRIRN